MKYVIMCGGEYTKFETPKHLSVINGERITDRTIRLLKENGIKEIYISSNNPIFDTCDAPRLQHKNTYKNDNGKESGYWLDAFYPFEDDEKVCYLCGDVYFSENAIKTIVNYESDKNTLFGTGLAKNEFHYNWGEPFAYKVFNNKEFKQGIVDVKKLQDEGKVIRTPVIWELYRYLNGLDINIQRVLDETYIAIDDESIDIDTPSQIEELNKKVVGK